MPIAGGSWLLPNHTVVVLHHGALVFNTSAAPDSLPPSPVAATALKALTPPAWVTLTETIGFGTQSTAAPAGSAPLEMLALTRNLVDYMYTGGGGARECVVAFRHDVWGRVCLRLCFPLFPLGKQQIALS